ncbi:Synaptojanin-1, partial [Geodia barretti]
SFSRCRLTTRGTDDSGHVGNFVETEQAIFVDSNVASFVQIRGGVPLFWEQPGLQTSGGMIKIKFSRGPVCSTPAFERHFEWCLLHYGPVMCVNLLGTRNQEQMLSKAYCEQFQHLSSAYCAEMACFDYHKFCKGQSTLANLEGIFFPLVNTFFSTHGFFAQTNAETQRRQTGMIRTNCLDCLDRSNSVQTFLGLQVMSQLMSDLGLQTKPSVVSRFQATFKQAWVRNGDNISLLYAGTRAMGRTEGKGLKLKDGARSVQRTILNNFLDKSKNEAMEMLLSCNARSGELGQKAVALLDRADVLAPLNFKQAMLERWSEYTIPEKLRVCIGTWNVNGGKHIHSIALRNQSMHDWLLDAPFIAGAVKEHPEEFAEPPDIFALGFQELVGLTASNIVSASSTNRKEWAMELQKVLSRDTRYELLTAEQMVGICLYIFIRPKLIPFIRDVAVSTVKTGMSGKAGNKGGVVVRFLLHSTSLCFVCSHLAAHQTKVTERNQDVHDICTKVQFPHGQTLESHDYVFWCGDLNYRIDLPTNVAKEHIVGRRWESLVLQDQLTKQRKLKKVFRGFVEGAMTFAPTYKYDQFSDDYDTSEKCRTPAWCDRILWRRKPLVADPSTNGMTSNTSQTSMASEDNLEVEGREESPSPTTLWDFGLHRSDAGKVYRREMEGGGGGELVNTGHPWHPGRLLFYGRAELKQSDHRPVVSHLEVDMYRVDRVKRGAVRKEVGLLLGPSDPTIVVSEPEGDTVDMTALVDSVKKYGEVVLVRATEENILVTFKNSQSAMAATALNGDRVEGVKVEVSLRTPWLLLDENKGAEGDSGGPETSETPPGGVVSRKPQRDKELLRKRLSLLAVTPDGGCDQEMGSEVNDDELLEFSFTGEAPPMSSEELGEGVEEEYGDENGMEPESDEAGGMEPDQEEGVESYSSSSLSDVEEEMGAEGGREEEEERPVTVKINSPPPEPADPPSTTSSPSSEQKPVPRPRSHSSRSPIPSPAHSPTPPETGCHRDPKFSERQTSCPPATLQTPCPPETTPTSHANQESSAQSSSQTSQQTSTSSLVARDFHSHKSTTCLFMPVIE